MIKSVKPRFDSNTTAVERKFWKQRIKSLCDNTMSCNLGSINLDAFIKKPFTDDAFFDLERFREVVMHMTWGLDELLTILGQRHALPEQIEHVVDWREIGLTY